MTSIRPSLLLGAALLAGSLGTAQAADLGSIKDYGAPIVAPQVSMYSPASWYIRGDVGHGSFDDPTMTEHTATAEYELVRPSIKNNWVLGGGVGRYLGSNARADITLDYSFKSDVHGFNAAGAAPGVLAPAHYRFGLRSLTGLLNFYYDFGARSGFNPYIGAGVGFVNHRTTAGTVEGECPCDGITGTIAGKSRTDLAAALMAGVSSEIRTNLHVDVGYRFLYLGRADTGAVDGTTNVGGVVTPGIVEDPRVTDIHSHQFRVGLRYDLSR